MRNAGEHATVNAARAIVERARGLERVPLESNERLSSPNCCCNPLPLADRTVGPCVLAHQRIDLFSERFLESRWPHVRESATQDVSLLLQSSERR